MEMLDAETGSVPILDIEDDMDFEIEDLSELDIYASTISLCSSTCSACCG